MVRSNDDPHPYPPHLLTTRLEHDVRWLARAPRDPCSPHHRASADYIADVMRTAGWEIEWQTTEIANVACRSVVTRAHAPTDVPVLVVGAHYDTPPGVPGADDNASAVAALLEIARLFAPAASAAPVVELQLAAYDREEDCLGGSRLHCQSFRRDERPLLGMIALEMLGFATDRLGSQYVPARSPQPLPPTGDFIAVCGNEASASLTAHVTRGLQEVLGTRVQTIVTTGTGLEFPESRRSDHCVFWDDGYPAVMVTDTSLCRNPHYHTARDTPETLNYEFLTNVTRGLCLAIASCLRAPATAVRPSRPT